MPGYTIAYYADGKRIRERAATIEAARQQAKAKIVELTSGAAHVGSLRSHCGRRQRKGLRGATTTYGEL